MSFEEWVKLELYSILELPLDYDGGLTVLLLPLSVKVLLNFIIPEFMIYPFLISWANIYDQSALKLGFFVSIFFNKLTSLGDMNGSLGMTTYSLSIFIMSCPILLDSKGQNP